MITITYTTAETTATAEYKHHPSRCPYTAGCENCLRKGEVVDHIVTHLGPEMEIPELPPNEPVRRAIGKISPSRIRENKLKVHRQVGFGFYRG